MRKFRHGEASGAEDGKLHAVAEEEFGNASARARQPLVRGGQSRLFLILTFHFFTLFLSFVQHVHCSPDTGRSRCDSDELSNAGTPHTPASPDLVVGFPRLLELICGY